MKDKTLTDILLICKGWYNETKYKNILEALNGYYHKYYGCEDIEMDKTFAIQLFLQPLALEAIQREPKLANYLFGNCGVSSNEGSFAEVMYDKLIYLIGMIKQNTFDLSEYEKMFSEFDYISEYEYEVEYCKKLGVI